MPNRVRGPTSPFSADDDCARADRNPGETPSRLPLGRIIEMAVIQVFGIKNGRLTQAQRGEAQRAFARQVAMYLAHVGFSMSFTDVGRHFGRDRTTVAHACAVVEDRRDDPAIDRALDLLEWALPVMAARPAIHSFRH